ncbi:MAG: cyclic 2,3-diphosphoglycerate synthase [Vulcanimicrobiota bacterium]
MRKRVLIMGAAGRDFHNFNMVYRDRPEYEVVAFTATQIPGIEGRRYPPGLAGDLYPQGIPIEPESELARLAQTVDEVVFSYSDVNYPYLMERASTALAAGADFRLLGMGSTCLKSKLPVVAVCAVRTGVGKSQTSRKLTALLKAAGKKVAVLRHPMPYGNLEAQAVQRFATLADLDRHRCTIEEREEYAPHLEEGHLVFAGVDYAQILEQAEAEAEVILWDGGNNDLPFLVPDLHLTLVDPHRPGHELSYYPGQANLRAADVVVINKVDSAEPAALAHVRANLARVNPSARVIEAASVIEVDEAVAGRPVVVIEDGPTLTHGEMGYGAGLLAARRLGCEVIDPRPHAVGSLLEVFAKWSHLGPVLPAMGYSQEQCEELRQTIAATPAEAILVGTPIDLSLVIDLDKPAYRVRYNLQERVGSLQAELSRFGLL